MFDFSQPFTEIHNVITLHICYLHIQDLIHAGFNTFVQICLIKMMWDTLKMGVCKLYSDLELTEGLQVLSHLRQGYTCVVLPVGREVSLIDEGHKLSESHGLKIVMIELDPLDEVDIHLQYCRACA